MSARLYRVKQDGTIEPVPELLTMREQFAMAAMHGLCINQSRTGHDAEQIARMATYAADELIAELARTSP